MKFGIFKERINKQNKPLLFSPDALARLQQIYPGFIVTVESTFSTVFSDDQYRKMNIQVATDLTDCDVFFAVNEVAIEDLIPNKSYFFFSKGFNMQQYTGKLLETLAQKKIDLYALDAFIDSQSIALFDKKNDDGCVGVYNSFRAFGIKFELFKLPKAIALSGKQEMITHLKRLVLPPIKIVISANGSLLDGVKEILKAMKIKEVSVENYLTKNYTQPVFVTIDLLDIYVRKDGQQANIYDLYKHPNDFVSYFERFSKVSDMYISACNQTNNLPEILNRQMLLSSDCKIKVIADLSSDIDNSIAYTLRKAAVGEPLFGYWPLENKEVEIFHPAAIVVAATDCDTFELPNESDNGYAELMMEQVISAYFNGDKDQILQNAKITNDKN